MTCQRVCHDVFVRVESRLSNWRGFAIVCQEVWSRTREELDYETVASGQGNTAFGAANGRVVVRARRCISSQRQQICTTQDFDSSYRVKFICRVRHAYNKITPTDQPKSGVEAVG